MMLTPAFEETFLDVIGQLMVSANANAIEKGFYADEVFIQQEILDRAKAVAELGNRTEEQLAEYDSAKAWLKSTAEQAALARMHSEISEWLEGVRKPGTADKHCPEFKSQEVEAADLFIRLLDTCARHSYRLGEATLAKMQFNKKRPYKHSKNS